MKRKISIVVPLWGRPEVFRLVARQLVNCHTPWWEAGYEVKFVFIVSPEDRHKESLLELCEKVADCVGGRFCEISECSNEFLGAKHNYAFELATQSNPDYVMNLGSDDLLHPAILDFYKPMMDINWPIFGLKGCYFYSPAEAAFYFRYADDNPHALGAGRMISRDALKHMQQHNIPLYRPTAQRGLDTISAIALMQQDFHQQVLEPGEFPFIVDIKSDVSITSIERLLRAEQNTMIPIHRRYLHSNFPCLAELEVV